MTGSISDEARRLIELSDEVPGAIDIAHNAISYDQSIFNSVLEIVGNMHDPFVVTMSVHIKHADQLLEDYIRNIKDIETRIRSHGFKLMRLS